MPCVIVIGVWIVVCECVVAWVACCCGVACCYVGGCWVAIVCWVWVDGWAVGVVVFGVDVSEWIFISVISSYDDEHHYALTTSVRKVVFETEGWIALALGTKCFVSTKLKRVDTFGWHTVTLLWLSIVTEEIISQCILSPVQELPVVAPLHVVISSEIRLDVSVTIKISIWIGIISSALPPKLRSECVCIIWIMECVILGLILIKVCFVVFHAIVGILSYIITIVSAIWVPN